MIYTKQLNRWCKGNHTEKEIDKNEALSMIDEHECNNGLPEELEEALNQDNYTPYEEYLFEIFHKFEENGFYECGDYVLRATRRELYERL